MQGSLSIYCPVLYCYFLILVILPCVLLSYVYNKAVISFCFSMIVNKGFWYQYSVVGGYVWWLNVCFGALRCSLMFLGLRVHQYCGLSLKFSISTSIHRSCSSEVKVNAATCWETLSIPWTLRGENGSASALTVFLPVCPLSKYDSIPLDVEDANAAISTWSSGCSFVSRSCSSCTYISCFSFNKCCRAMRAAMSASALMHAEEAVEWLDLLPMELSGLRLLLPAELSARFSTSDIWQTVARFYFIWCVSETLSGNLTNEMGVSSWTRWSFPCISRQGAVITFMLSGKRSPEFR